MRIYNPVTGQWEEKEKKKPEYLGSSGTGEKYSPVSAKPLLPTEFHKLETAQRPERQAPQTDLRAMNAGVLTAQPKRVGQPSPMELAMQKRQAYQTQTRQPTQPVTTKPLLPTSFPQEPKKLDGIYALRGVPGLPTKFSPASSYLTGGAEVQKGPASSYGAAGSFTPEQIAAAKRRQQAQDDYRRAVAAFQNYSIDDFLKKPGAFTEAEKEAAGKTLAAMEQVYGPQIRKYQGSPRDGMGAQVLPDELKIMQAKMEALKLKTRAGEAALYGVLDSATMGISDKLERETDAKTLAGYYEPGRMLSPLELANKLILESKGGKSSFGVAKEQSPLAYSAAKFGAEGMKYALGAKAFEAVPLAGKLAEQAGAGLSKLTGGKISTQVMTRLAEGRVTDLPFDIVNAALEADSPETFAKSLLGDQAMGLAADVSMEGIAAGWRAIRGNFTKQGRLEKLMDPKNIQNADIDAYLEKRGGASRAETFQSGDDYERKLLSVMKEEYKNSADPELRQFAEEALNTSDKNWRNLMNYDLAPVNKHQANDVYRLTGIDVSGYQNNIKGNSISHINERHGIDGKHDASMTDVNDIARLGYALEHYDSVEKLLNSDGTPVKSKEFMNKDNTPADVLRYTKRINGTLYIIEAVPDTKAKKMRVITAYISPTKKGAEQVLYMPEGPQLTSKTPLASVPASSIPPQTLDFNGQNGGNFEGRIDGPLIEAAEKARAAQESAINAPMEDALAIKAKMENAPGQTDTFGKNTVGAAESAFPHKQKVSQLYDNTFQKTDVFTKAEKAMANAQGLDKDFQYDVISEKQSMAEAMQRVETDLEGELADLPKKGSFGGSDVDTSILILEKKLEQARIDGNYDDVKKWAKMIQKKGTEAGQMIQAFAKYSRTPEGTLVKAEKVIADYSEKLRKANPKLFNAIDEFADQLERASIDFKYDLPADPDAAVAKLKNAIEDMAKKHGKVELDDDLTDEIIRAIKEGRSDKDDIFDIVSGGYGVPRLTDEEVGQIMDIMAKAEDLPLYSKQRWQTENQAWKIVADHFDASFMDKWNAWRYMSMLGNPRTHIRNMVGNTGFNIVTRVKNSVAAVIEAAADKLSPNGIARTKTLAALGDRELQKGAKADFENMYSLVMGNGKYNPSNMLRDNQTVFKHKILEKPRQLNSSLLELEDEIAMKDRYAASLAGYLKANGADKGIFQNTSDEAQALLNEARAYAAQEAKKATFRDDSKLATALNNMSRSSKAANVVIEGIIPFKKTPINIVKRGMEYSPAGLAKGLTYDLYHAVKTGRKTAAEAIDQIAAGATGSVIMGLGALLASQGRISGSASADAKERGFDALTGNQNYALVIGDKSYTLDWAAPAALPLFIGVETYKTLQERGRGDLTTAEMIDSITKIAEPVLDMTMMQGLNDAIQSAGYNQTSALSSITGNALANYATQGLPTMFGQVARAMDDTRRSTYYGGGAFLDRYLPENVKTAANGNPLAEKAIQAELPKPVDIALQKAMAKTPWLSMWLNPKVDQWGREQKNQGGSFGGRLAYNMLSPGFYSERNMTEVDREIERLYGETQGDKSVLPGFAAKTIAQKDAEGNKETKRLTAREFTKFAKDKGGAAYKSLDTLFQSEAYKRADDENKGKMVSDIYEYANAAAKTGVSNYKPSDWVKKAMEAKKDGIPLEDYVVCRNILTPLKHNVEKNEALAAMDVKPKTKETLYKYFVSDSEGSRKKIDAFKAAGLDMDDYLTAQIEYAHIEDGGGSAQEKATAFYHWLDTQRLNEREYEAVAASMPFFQMFPAKPKAYRVDMMSESGQKKWAKAKAWGLSEKQYVKYYAIATQQKKKAEIFRELQKAGMDSRQAEYFWRIVKGK